jgi:hypothetical protein
VSGLNDYAPEGTLTINSISMNRPAWAVSGDERGQGGLRQLLTTVEKRGDDRVIPGATGVIPYPRRKTRTVLDLRIVITGEVDQAGALNSDQRVGFDVNLQYLYTNVVNTDTVAPTTGLVAATWDPIGATATVSASIHVIGLFIESYSVRTGQSIGEGTLRISIPAGRFA